MNWELIRNNKPLSMNSFKQLLAELTPLVTLLFISKSLFMTGKDTMHRERSNSNEVQGIKLFPAIYCFQKLIPCSSLCVHAAPFVYRSYHVSVNHARAVLLSENTMTPKTERD